MSPETLFAHAPTTSLPVVDFENVDIDATIDAALGNLGLWATWEAQVV